MALVLAIVAAVVALVIALVAASRARRRPTVVHDTKPRNARAAARSEIVGRRIVDVVETPAFEIVPLGESPFGVSSREVFVLLDDGKHLHLAFADPPYGTPVTFADLPPCPMTRSDVAAQVAGQTIVELVASSLCWGFGLALSGRVVLYFTMPGLTAFVACVDPIGEVDEPRYLQTDAPLDWNDVYGEEAAR